MAEPISPSEHVVTSLLTRILCEYTDRDGAIAIVVIANETGETVQVVNASHSARGPGFVANSLANAAREMAEIAIAQAAPIAHD